MQHIIIAEPGSLHYEEAVEFIRAQYVKKFNCHLVAHPPIIHMLYDGDTLLGTIGLAHDTSKPYSFEYCDPPHVAKLFLNGSPRHKLAEITRFTLKEDNTPDQAFRYGKILMRSLVTDARARSITHLGFMSKPYILRLFEGLNVHTEKLGTPTFTPPAEGEQFGSYAHQRNIHVFGAHLSH